MTAVERLRATNRTPKDCVCRTIAIAAGLDYQKVYDLLMEMTPDHATKGVLKPATRAFLARLGWLWHPCMFITQAAKVHLPGERRQDEATSSAPRVSSG